MSLNPLQPQAGPSRSELYVQQLAATNPQLYNQAFGNNSSLGRLVSAPNSILNNPAYGGFTQQQTMQILQGAEGLFQTGISISPMAQQLNQMAQIGLVQQQQMLGIGMMPGIGTPGMGVQGLGGQGLGVPGMPQIGGFPPQSMGGNLMMPQQSSLAQGLSQLSAMVQQLLTMMTGLISALQGGGGSPFGR
jgi:hypothetical protein